MDAKVVNAGDSLDLELAVVGFLHRAVFPHHQGRYRLGALDVRDIETLDAAGQFREQQSVLQRLRRWPSWKAAARGSADRNSAWRSARPGRRASACLPAGAQPARPCGGCLSASSVHKDARSAKINWHLGSIGERSLASMIKLLEQCREKRGWIKHARCGRDCEWRVSVVSSGLRPTGPAGLPRRCRGGRQSCQPRTWNRSTASMPFS